MEKKDIMNLLDKYLEPVYHNTTVENQIEIRALQRAINDVLNKKRSITIPFSENDVQELGSGEEFDWCFPTEDGEDINVNIRLETEEDWEN